MKENKITNYKATLYGSMYCECVVFIGVKSTSKKDINIIERYTTLRYMKINNNKNLSK